VSSLEFDYFANVFRFRQPPYQTETCVCVPLEAVNNFPVEKQTTINYRIKNLLRPMQVTEIEDLVNDLKQANGRRTIRKRLRSKNAI